MAMLALRRPPAMALLIGALLALTALMLGAIAARERLARWYAASPTIELAAGPEDHEQGYFAHCRGPSRFTCVIDGDTIWYRGSKIRLADINAPEVSEPACDYELDLGEKATERLIALLNAGRFRLVPLSGRDARDADVYGRKLRTIMRGRHSLGEVLVVEGLAERWVGFRRDWCDG